MQSTKVACEDEDHRARRPKVAEAVLSTIGAGEYDLLQLVEVHPVSKTVVNNVDERITKDFSTSTAVEGR
jgi:hypothetical protein